MKLSRLLPARSSGALSVLVAIALCLGAATTASRVSAQDAAVSGVEPPAYRDAIKEALSEYRARNFPEARALFAEAHKLYPNARTLRGLGMTAFELRSYRESIEYLQDALKSQVKPLDNQLRGETERLIARAERFVGKLRLTVSPAEASVLIDGSPVTHAAETEITLEVGEHNVEILAEGYHGETRSVYIKGKETEVWSVVLPAIPAATPEPVVAAVPPPEQVARQAEEPKGPRYYSLDTTERNDKKPLYKNPWLWTGVGAVVVTAIIVGVVVGTRKTEIGKTQTSDNTPVNGLFTALQRHP